MLKIEAIDSQAFAEYLLNSVALIEEDKGQTDYYVKTEKSVIPFENSFRLTGEGSREFGLHGFDFSKNKEPFLHLFNGRDPRDGGESKLVQNAKERKKSIVKEDDDKEFRKVGYDCCFSSSKEFSIAIAHAKVMGGKDLEDKLVNIHREAVAYALQEMEKNVIARSGAQGAIKEKGVKCFIAQVDHFDTRPTVLIDDAGEPLLDDKGEPRTVTDCQIHTHSILMNYGICQDGKARALDGLSVSRQIQLGTALYRMKQAELIQQLGLSVTSHRDTDDYGAVQTMSFKMNGVTEEAKNEFSHRHADIQVYMEEYGVSSQTAALATRSDKELNYDELEVEWRERMDVLASNDVNWIDLKPHSFENEVDEVPSDEAILDLVHRFKHRVAITETDIRAVAAQCLVGHDNAIARTEETLNRIVNNPDLICSLSDLDELGNPQFTSMKLVEADLQIRNYVHKKQDSHEHDIDPKIVEKAMEDFEAEKTAELHTPIKLSDEQKNAIRIACSSDLTVTQGFAGTGKSWSSRVTSDVLKSTYEGAGAGYKVYGVSVANLASLNLQEEAKIEGSSAVKMLADYEAGKIKFDNKSVIIFDEAGMTSIRMLAEFTKLSDETGAKLILIGDTRQLSAVGDGGNGLKVVEQVIADNNLATLKNIQRQKDQKDKDIAIEFYDMKNKDDSLRQYATLEKYGYIGITKNNDEAIQKIAQEYVDHPSAMKDKLVMASTNQTVQQLNRAIQSKYIKDGKIGAIPIRKIGMYQFHEGSPVRFTNSKRFSKEVKVVNGTQGIVVATKDGSLQVQLDTGEIVTIPEDFKSLDLNYAITINRAQGQSKSTVWTCVDSSFKSSQSLVSFTRMKNEVKFYGNEENMESFSKQMHILDKEAGAFEKLSEESKKVALRKKGLSECQIRKKVKEAEVATRARMIKEENKKEIILTTLSTKSRKHLRERWQLKFRKQLKKNATLTIPDIQQENKQVHAMNNEEVDREVEQAMNVAGNRVRAKPPTIEDYKYLSPWTVRYRLSLKDDSEGIRIVYANATSMKIHKDGSVKIAEGSLAGKHAYQVVRELVKHQHFDPTRSIQINVSETLANFDEEKQAQAIKQMIEALQAGGVSSNMITIGNEKHRHLLDVYKQKDAITITQDKAPVVKTVEPVIAEAVDEKADTVKSDDFFKTLHDNAEAKRDERRHGKIRSATALTQPVTKSGRSPLNTAEGGPAIDALYDRSGLGMADVLGKAAFLMKKNLQVPVATKKTLEQLEREQDQADLRMAQQRQQKMEESFASQPALAEAQDESERRRRSTPNI